MKQKRKAKNNKNSSYLKNINDRFLRIQGNPRAIASGFALGLFVGMAPIMGLQTALTVFLAALLKWNKISAALGVWITNPATAPFIYGINYFVGSKILSIDKLHTLPAELDTTTVIQLLKNAPEILGILTVGGLVTGLPVAIIGYYFSYTTVVQYREKLHPKLIEKKKIAKNRLKKRRKKKKKK
jgi:uncharacterized protein (TIGR03546 family)